MNIKQILEKEFDSKITVYESVDSIEYYVYKHNNKILYFFIKIEKEKIIKSICFPMFKIFHFTEPISELYWIIFCIKNVDWIDNLYKMITDKTQKRNFKLNILLND